MGGYCGRDACALKGGDLNERDTRASKHPLGLAGRCVCPASRPSLILGHCSESGLGRHMIQRTPVWHTAR